jgi:hypothetical protein
MAITVAHARPSDAGGRVWIRSADQMSTLQIRWDGSNRYFSIDLPPNKTAICLWYNLSIPLLPARRSVD